MSELENPSQQAESTTSEAPVKATRRSNPMGLAALLVALLVGVVAVVIWSDVREMRRESQGAESQLRSSVDELQQWAQEQRSSLTAEMQARNQQLAARGDALEQGLQGLREELTRDRVEWSVAESDYLMRIASRRLQLERDVRGAVIALRSADALLAEGSNPLYLPVREKLREEILALEALPQIDVDGLSLELSTLSRQLEKMPLSTARRAIADYQAGVKEGSDADTSWFSRLLHSMWNDVKSLVTVRRLDQKVQPLLPPEQRYFLVENLRLRLEMARLALLRGDKLLYQENLQTAAQWLDDYFDSDDSAVRSSLTSLKRLAAVNIAPALPEIGDALAALEKIRGKGGNGRGKKS